jgi:type IV pilus assembly protein PilM
VLQFFQNFKGMQSLKLLNNVNLYKLKNYFNYFRKERANLLAIDIGASSIKLVEIGKKGDELILEKFSILPLPNGCIERRQIKNYSVLTEILSRFILEHGYVNHEAALILSGPQIVTQILKVPKELTDMQLMTHLELEAEKYLPFKIDELAIDFALLPINEHTQQDGYREVLLAAAKKDYIAAYINVIKAVALKLCVIDVYGCIMGRLSMVSTKNQLQEDMQDKIIAMVDIGQDILTVSIFKNNRQLYLKENNFGSKELNRLIMQEYSVSYEQAEVLKFNYEDPIIFTLINNFKEQLSVQIFQMLQLFYSSVFSETVNYVFILGGMAQLPELDRVIAGKINLPVYVLNSFIGINVDKYSNTNNMAQLNSRLSLACGLALRSYVE